MAKTHTTTISVEQRHIKAGIRQSSDRCPVALAIEDAGLDRPCVHSCGIQWMVFNDGDETTYMRSPMPSRVRDFMDDFDAGGYSPPPFTFTLTSEAY